MSKEIQISNGKVTIKDYCPRRVRKEINKALYNDAQIEADQSGGKLQGMTMEAMDKANDTALVNMVEKVELDGEDKPVKLATFDEMDANDVDKVIDEINKVTSPELGNG